VATIVDDGDRHRPLVAQGLGLGGGGDGFQVGQFEDGFGFHGTSTLSKWGFWRAL